MRFKEALILAAILAGVAALAVLLYRLSKPPEVSAGGERRPVLPEGVQVALEGKSLVTSSERGKITWTMRSRGISYYDAAGRVEVERPLAEVPVEQGGTVDIVGDRGGYFESSEDFELVGDVNVSMSKTGRLEWTISGDTASYRKARDSFFIGGVEGTIHPESGDSVAIKGGQGRYDIKPRTMRLERDVRCRWSGGVELFTDWLDYDAGKETASTDADVRIVGQGWTLEGRGMDAELKTNYVVVRESVHLVMEKGLSGLKGTKPPGLRAKSATVEKGGKKEK